MKKWAYFICLFILLIACHNGSKYDKALHNISGILNDNPSMALSKLDSLRQYWDNFSRGTQMRWQLLRLSAQNKCDTAFQSDSLQLVLVDYFDSHGTPNEKMFANYLLGRAYSDMGEAPQALKWLHRAVESADTAATDCDFYTLCGIYGQIALTFERNNLYREEIEAWEKYSHFSLKDGDTLDYIQGIAFQEIPLFCLNDTLNLMRITENARKLYLENGQNERAAEVYAPVILMLLQNKQYQQAYTIMQTFEGESGLFDSHGNIAKGREHYYYCRGLYHLGVNQIDSAEHYFRKLLPFNVNRNYDAFRGLHAVYRTRHDIDSVMKYSTLSEQALDSIHNDDQSEALAIAHSLYNYGRMERIVEQGEIKMKRMRWRLALAGVVGLAIIILLIQRYRRYKESKERELELLVKDYHVKVCRLEQAKNDLRLLEEDKNRLAEERRNDIAQLEKEVDIYRERFMHISNHGKETALTKNPIAISLHEKAKGKLNTDLPAETEWSQLARAFLDNHISFYTDILQNDRLTEEEKKLCMLCRLNFRNGEMAVLLGKSPQNISNMKSNLNNKLFASKTASELKLNLKQL